MPGNPQVLGLLEEMLDSGKTPEEVCRDCPTLLPEVRQRWQDFCRIDAQVGALLPGLQTPPEADTIAPVSPPAGLPQVPGYAVEAMLGCGGMGVVYKARHLALKRTVALKMLAAGHCHPADRARFKAEAEAVARLQHPNIVQIHEVGEADGQPFFALEFVAGGSLAERLARQPLPPRDAARLVAALAAAMHLAHSRNLVHRDLKPGNVLLAGEPDTPIGQCQPKVTDFGLARQLDADPGQTRIGVVMGTPSYMAPEQAEGRAHAAGPAADVYALGAILYECLTGRPPFVGSLPLAILEQVRNQEPVAPSALKPGLPRDLETICLKCLRKEPERRYSSARELADDLGRFVRGEPVAARPVGAAERLRKWVRRGPAAAGLLVAVVLLVALGGVGVWLLAAAGARQAQTDGQVGEVLKRARGLLEEGWLAHDLAKLAEARAEANRAVDVAHSGGASPAVRDEAEAFRNDAVGRLERATKNDALLDALRDVLAPQESDADLRGAAGLMLAPPSLDEQYADAFRRWGLDVDGTAEAEVVERLRQEPPVVLQELIAALDAWMLERRLRRSPEAEWGRLVRVAEQLDVSERRRRLRTWLLGASPPRADAVAGIVGMGSPWPALWEIARGNAWRGLVELRGEIKPQTEPVLTVVLLARALAAVGDFGGAEDVLRQAATARPHQVVLLDALANLLERQGPSRREAAFGYYRAARGQRPQLGLALTRTLVVANRATEAQEVMEDLVLRQPNNPTFQVFLGIAAYYQGNAGEAQTIFRKALDLNPNLAEAYYCLGIMRSDQQRDDEAEADYCKAIDLKPDFAEAHYNLGGVLYRQKKPAAAAAAFRKAGQFKPNFDAAFTNLGIMLREQGKPVEAEAAFRKAIELRPNSASYYSNLGLALHDQGKDVEAEEACRKAIDLRPDLALAHCNLGIALNGQKKPVEAEAACRRAIELQPDLARAHGTLGGVLLDRQQYREAEAPLRKAIELQPDYADAYYNLGIVLSRLRKHAAAESTFRKAIDLQQVSAEGYNDFGMVLGQQGKHVEAEAAFRKAIDLQPQLVQAHVNLGTALLGQQKCAEAEAVLRNAVDTQPDFGLPRFWLGKALLRQARFDEAAAVLQKAADALPAQDTQRKQVVQLRQLCAKCATLDARLPATLRGEEKPANAAEQVDFAQICFWKGQYVAAACFCRDACRAEPQRAEAAPAGIRYLGACAAARAGCGQGKDADELGDEECARWRRQALDWLRQDLTWWGEAPTNAQLSLALRQWQADASFAGVRGKDALARLPDEERKQWERLWSDVDALLRRVSVPE